MAPQEEREYLQSLKPGEEVIETGNSATKGYKGIVHVSTNPGRTFGSKCVKWQNGMSTSVTHGTRRINEN